jgi:hypothetical protein
MSQIALLPLDDRPVSYLLPKQIAEFSGLDLVLPERNYLSNLKNGSDLNYIDQWFDELKNPMMVISLDNFVYGGLVQSRKHDFTLEQLKKRVEVIHKLLLKAKTPIYGFSSIMRIPNYDNDEEEKPYWKDYGKKLFNWSELMYRVGRGILLKGETNDSLINKWYESSKLIPKEILADFKSHRDKNFTVNSLWLEFLGEKIFEYLIFSCDDSAKYGMNVVEAEFLDKLIRKQNVIDKVKTISGTDEIALILMTKAILNKSDAKPSLSIFWGCEIGKDNLAKYESGTISTSVTNQIKLLNLDLKSKEKADINLFVHLSSSNQGDHIFKDHIPDTTKSTESIIKNLEKNNKPFVLLDLAYANGADPNLVEKLLEAKINWDLCYGFAGWNTCANSTGSALAMGINRWVSEKQSTFSLDSFKKCLLVRFLDDYAYQSKVRHININQSELEETMSPYADRFLKVFHMDKIDVKFSLPWNRSFEIEINV